MASNGSDLILDRLQALHPKAIDLSLGRVERLLAALGHPERRLPPVVHIAGTNGKGSTLAMLDAMLTAGGHTVDRYISPHLVHFAERILKRGESIDEARLASVLDRCERANEGEPITFFEITTAAAFLAYLDDPADWVLLETGLGGRLDATNVVSQPRLCLISPVSMDHESYLGDTIAKIAGEKAGILKPGVPAIIGRQEPDAHAVFAARAAEISAPLLVHGRDWTSREEGGHLVVETTSRRLVLPMPALAGLHQIDNAGLATMAALSLTEAHLDEQAIAAGLTGARWAARLQRLRTGPIVEAMPEGCAVWLDGGHNPAAGEMLARTFAATSVRRPLHVIVGMLTTKDIGSFLTPLATAATSLRAVSIPGSAPSYTPEEIVALARGLGLRASGHASAEAAAAEIARDETAPFDLLICGSLYLAGDVLRRHA
ncbi:MAG: folylpolyglutamate synthase/dihydrofolate synthase family protein [Geminicoccaceae bacterium]